MGRQVSMMSLFIIKSIAWSGYVSNSLALIGISVDNVVSDQWGNMFETFITVVVYYVLTPAFFFIFAHAMTSSLIMRNDCLITNYDVIPPHWLLQLLKQTDIFRIYRTIEDKHQFKFRLEGLLTFLFLEVPFIFVILLYYVALFIDIEWARELVLFLFRYFSWYIIIIAILGFIRIIVKFLLRFKWNKCWLLWNSKILLVETYDYITQR
jgi:hypothetical protein